MNEMPFDAVQIAGSHAALTSVMAGFALAGLFLLVEQFRNAETAAHKSQFGKAMLLLFACSVTGTLASFLFAMITGDPPRRAMLLFAMPSAVFAVTVMVLLTGINLIFNTFNAVEVGRLARRISYVTVLFAISAVWDTVTATASFFNLPGTTIFLITLVTFAPPLVAALLLFLRHVSGRTWSENSSFSTYCYAILFATVANAVVHLVHAKIPDSQITWSPWVAFVVAITTALLGAWTMLILPHDASA